MDPTKIVIIKTITTVITTTTIFYHGTITKNETKYETMTETIDNEEYIITQVIDELLGFVEEPEPPPKPKRKYLVFTSAGDRTEYYTMWNDPSREYDIYVCYYGSRIDRPYESYADYYVESKGSKFQNFYKLWQSDPKLLDYERYFILDDDVVIHTAEINRLFNIHETLDLWLLQPAFKFGEGKLSHPITEQQTKTSKGLRFVNFIEVTAMMFDKGSLEKCMTIYDPILVGFGIDWLFLWHLGYVYRNKYAIIDDIPCINPVEEDARREINILQPLKERQKCWEMVRKKYKITCWKPKIYGTTSIP
jgi:hypothetical protein